MVNYLTKRPCLICAICCIISSILGFYSKWAILFYTILIFLWLIFNIITRKGLAVIIIFLAILTVSLNIFNASCYVENISHLDGKTEKCRFIIKEISYKAKDYYFAEIEIIDSKFVKNSSLMATLHTPDTEIGDILTAHLKFSIPKNKPQYYGNGIYLSAYAYNETLQEETDFILKGVNSVRNYIRQTLFDRMDYSEASIMTALLFGDNSYFTNELYSAVTRAGVNHVMVISGLHLSIMVSIFAFINNKFIYNRYVKAAIIFGVVFAVSALCGFTMSVMRAGVTYLIAALGLVLGRDTTPSNTLGAATVIILFISPFAIFNIAFQLSVLSTFGILCVAIPILNFLITRKLITAIISRSVITTILISLSAFLTTLPICIYNFGFVSKVGIISNLLICPAVTVVICLAFIALLLNLIFPPAAEIFFRCCEGVTYYINQTILILGNSDKSVLNINKNFAFVAVGIIMLVFWFLLACKKRIDMLKLEKKRKNILKKGE